MELARREGLQDQRAIGPDGISHAADIRTFQR
jgi:hypothetical protein